MKVGSDKKIFVGLLVKQKWDKEIVVRISIVICYYPID